jgi:hypothetical protein
LAEEKKALNRIREFLDGLPVKPSTYELQLETIETLAQIDAQDQRLAAQSQKTASLYQLIYSMTGLLVGLACMIGGIVLFLHGITGSTSWIIKMLGAESNITDAAPGAVLFIVGLFVVWVTKFKK